MTSDPPPKRCDECERLERASFWARLFTRVTECGRCGKFLCPACFDVDGACHEGYDHEAVQEP